MVLWFSGTGNSYFAARKIAGFLNDELMSVNDYLKSRQSGIFHSDKPFVFVMPVYAWRMPHIMEKFIMQGRFLGNRKAYFVLTPNADAGNSAYYAKRICDRKNLCYMGMKVIRMPENYIVLLKAPDEQHAREKIARAMPELQSVSEQIRKEEALSEINPGVFRVFISSAVNRIFYLLFVNDMLFRANQRCIGCGKCVSACPLSNIRLKDSHPVWGHYCTQCMGCISICPVKAIDYGFFTKGKRRYKFPSCDLPDDKTDR